MAMKSDSHIFRLKMLNLPIIEDLNDFTNYTHLSKKLIYNFSKHSKFNYKVYSIKKKNGTNRIIAQPSRRLKALQYWILRNILEKLETSPSCKGFEKGSNILQNAEPHTNSKAVLSLDIEDFFPSIKANWVFTIYHTLGYNNFISSVLTSISTYDGFLPQGSPCSPKLANLACWKLDSRLQGYVGKRNIVYTRYADDLTFSASTSPKLVKASRTIEKIVKDEGFNLNQSKTRISGYSRCRKVTGLVLTDDKTAGIGRKLLRILRVKLHKMAIKKKINKKEIEHIKGWLSFISNVDKKRYEMLGNYIKRFKNKTLSDLVK